VEKNIFMINIVTRRIKAIIIIVDIISTPKIGMDFEDSGSDSGTTSKNTIMVSYRPCRS